MDWPERDETVAGTSTEGSLAETAISVPSGRLVELNCSSQVTLSPACTCFGKQNRSLGRTLESVDAIAGVAPATVVWSAGLTVNCEVFVVPAAEMVCVIFLDPAVIVALTLLP